MNQLIGIAGGPGFRKADVRRRMTSPHRQSVARISEQLGSHQCHQPPLILHADNGNAIRAATLESWLEELGVLRSFSRPRLSNDNPYSESLVRTVKYRPDYANRPFANSEPRSMRKPAWPIQPAGAEAPGAGVNPKKCGSTSHQKSPNRSWHYR